MPELSVVIPFLNEAEHLPATLEALLAEIAAAGTSVEVILVDDGSTDDSARIASSVLASQTRFRVVGGSNVGRFRARSAGIAAAEAPLVMLLDARVRLHPGSLEFVLERARRGETVWTSHVHVETNGSVLATFWKLIADLGWRQYFDRPRTTSFGLEDFDRFPKGTTCFVAPRELLLEALAAFSTRYENLGNANDDTTMLRWIASQGPIHLSPSFAVSYASRTALPAFWRHSVHRGVVFVDGHARPESRFFLGAVLFFPISLVLVASTVHRPRNAFRYVVAVSTLAAALGAATRRSPREIVALGLVGPVYGLGHAIGMWKGAVLAILGHRNGSAVSPDAGRARVAETVER